MTVDPSQFETIYAQFSEWTPWLSRSDWSPDLAYPGVYVIGKKVDVAGQVKPVPDSALLYVGETCDQSLKERLIQFKYSALGGSAHSGGAKFKKLDPPVPLAEVLFAFIPSVKDVAEWSAFIRYAERAVIWQHVQRFGRLPACNSK